MKNCSSRRKPGQLLLKWLRKSAAVVVSFIMINQVAAQNTLDRAGLSSSTLASVAYSVRKLSSTYAGYALRIRRSSDNAAQDIGFTAGGHLDTISLKTFVGSGNGFITTWYDQSGNNINLTQATTSQQPVLLAKRHRW